MTNAETVLRFIDIHAPRKVSNSEIRSGTAIKPHQQVFQITQELLRKKQIEGRQIGHEWFFWGRPAPDTRTP